MSFLLDGLGGRQLITDGLGESAQSSAASRQARQQSSGTGYVGDQVVIPQGAYGTFQGHIGSTVAKKQSILGIGRSVQSPQESNGVSKLVLRGNGASIQPPQASEGLGKTILRGAGASAQAAQASSGTATVEMFSDQDLSAFMSMLMEEDALV